MNLKSVPADRMPTPWEIWMRYTDNEGRIHVMEHIVWDEDTFLAAKQAEAAAERTRAKPGKPALAAAERITRAEYQSARRMR